MSVARRFAAAFAVVGLGVLAYAVPASATGGGASTECITNPTADDLVAEIFPFRGSAEVRAADGVNVCADVVLSIYRVPATWKGKTFNETATPQTLLDSATGKVGGEGTLKLWVDVPKCGNLQIDLYFPPEITEVTAAGHGTKLILGKIWRWYDDAGNRILCTDVPPTPTETATTTPPVPTPTETATTTPPVPTPTETTTAPVPTPTETTTAPVPTTTETVTATPSATVTVPVPQPTEGLGTPVTILPPPAPPAPPVLAETGSNSTLPLIGIGLGLLVSGVALRLLGRRRTA